MKTGVEVIRVIGQAKQAYEAAKISGLGVRDAKQAYMNTLFNNADAIIAMLRDYECIAEECETLRLALKDADEQLTSLRKKQKSAPSAATKKGGDDRDGESKDGEN